MKSIACMLLSILWTSSDTLAAEPWGLKNGTPELQTAEALAFGRDDVLFVGVTKWAADFAFATGNIKGDSSDAEIIIDKLRAALSDVCAADVTINDLAAQPRGAVFVSVIAGDASAICQIDEA